jgi:hypothetical protein
MTPAYFNQPYYETYLQVRNESLLFYNLPANPKPHKRHKLLSPTYSGTTTDHAKKRIRKAIDMMLQLYPRTTIWNPVIEKYVSHQLSFITLTISSKERHLEAHEGHQLLLAPWLLRMKRKAGLKTYIWKAEFQKNGQLHYHITTPSFIPYSLIRDEWNNILRKQGLLSNYQFYTEKSPNSTDVHSVYKVKNIQAYLTKYISKGNKDVIKYWKKFQVTCTNPKKETPKREPQQVSALRAQIVSESKKLPIFKITKGKVWDCSQNLKSNPHFTKLVPSNFELTVANLEHKDCDRCTIYFLTKPYSILPDPIAKEYKSYIVNIRKEEN